jgi:hypothetical protein
MQITKDSWETQALAAVSRNPVLAKLFMENANVGSENLSAGLPLLKVHSTGRSQKNELADGEEPNDGYFYYKPTKEQFKELNCHILTISKGFRADGYEDKKDVFNQIAAGVIIGDEGEFLPFMMYFTGIKLQNLWQFGKDASLYTKAKPMPIPLFALRIKMSTEKIKHTHGMGWVVKFEILKDESGFPLVISDEKLFIQLRDNVAKLEANIASLIEAKVTEDAAPSAPIPDDADFAL